MTDRNTDQDTVPPNNEISETTTRYVFKTNLGYVKTLPGILNASQTILSVVCLAIFAQYCNQLDHKHKSVGFIGGHQDTAFFIINCMCLIMSALMFICCTASAKTSYIMRKIIYTPATCLVSFLLCFGSSIALLENILRGNLPNTKLSHVYEGSIAAAIIGLVNCCVYGASFALFIFKKK